MILDGQVTTLAGKRKRGFADGPVLMRHPVPPWPSLYSLYPTPADSADLVLNVNELQLPVHESFVSLRCPALLKAALRVQPVDADSIALFSRLLYTDDGPADSVGPVQLFGVAVRDSFLLFFCWLGLRLLFFFVGMSLASSGNLADALFLLIAGFCNTFFFLAHFYSA